MTIFRKTFFEQGVLMGMKRYDDDALRARALELWKEGLSYREIARRLGCSTYKVYELLSPQENTQSRTKRIEELARRLHACQKD
jgi:DNA invertase Pin-like site-specific DNA recombinase